MGPPFEGGVVDGSVSGKRVREHPRILSTQEGSLGFRQGCRVRRLPTAFESQSLHVPLREARESAPDPTLLLAHPHRRISRAKITMNNGIGNGNDNDHDKKCIRTFMLARATPRALSALPGVFIALPSKKSGGKGTGGGSKAETDPELAGSNVLSVGEGVLLKWMSYHLEQANRVSERVMPQVT